MKYIIHEANMPNMPTFVAEKCAMERHPLTKSKTEIMN